MKETSPSLKNLPTISGEELKDISIPTNKLIHMAQHRFLINFSKDVKEYEDEKGITFRHSHNGLLTWKDNNLEFIRDDFEKVDYAKYEDSYSESEMHEFVDDMFGEETPIERMRRLMYGYTFIDEYRYKIPQYFQIKYWHRQEMEDLSEWQVDNIVDTILSTGDGRTPETSFCVIDIEQEYDLIKELMPIETPLVINNSLLLGYIDCLELEPNPFGLDRIYFDISKRLEVGYNVREE